jgi:hypothetical protein
MDKTAAQTALKACEFFNNFEEDQLSLLIESGQTRQFSKGEDIDPINIISYSVMAWFLMTRNIHASLLRLFCTPEATLTSSNINLTHKVKLSKKDIKRHKMLLPDK